MEKISFQAFYVVKARPWKLYFANIFAHLQSFFQCGMGPVLKYQLGKIGAFLDAILKKGQVATRTIDDQLWFYLVHSELTHYLSKI